MYSIIYKYENNEVIEYGFNTVSECMAQLEREGFDMTRPVDHETLTNGNGTFATIKYLG